MVQANNGDAVKVHYTGRLTDGSIFDSSEGREPLAFTMGRGMMIAGFEAGILGMKIGEKKSVQIAPENAYGLADDTKYFPVNKSDLPQDMPLEIGLPLTADAGDGRPFQVVIKEVHPEYVVLDANHALAGKDLIFDIELVEVNGSQSKSGLIY
ncbi:MAG: peptidylprolyl isomerase [Bacteroidetes bacterium]|nr:MAG: peptidylprolyl isomerase [Bacteroidota bacterium]